MFSIFFSFSGASCSGEEGWPGGWQGGRTGRELAGGGPLFEQGFIFNGISRVEKYWTCLLSLSLFSTIFYFNFQ